MPAASELDVALDQIRRAQLALDLLLHRAQLAQGLEIEIAAIDELAELAEQLASQLQCTGNRPRPQQRRALPGLAEALVKAQRSFQRTDQRRAAAARTQTQIDPKCAAQQLGDHFADPRRRQLGRL